MSRLEIQDLVAGYWGYVPVLQGLSLTAEEGKVTTIIGPNGAGKSTVLKSVYGYLKPRSGTIRFNGEDIVAQPPHQLLRKGLAFVPQEPTVFPELTIHENLEIGSWTLRHQARARKKAIEGVYQRFPVLHEKRKAQGRTLSGGQRRMLEFARALLTVPQMLLIDEPTVGLSPLMMDDVYRIIQGLSQSGLTILMVDQNVRRALGVSDYVYVLELGKVSDHGPITKFQESDVLKAMYLRGSA